MSDTFRLTMAQLDATLGDLSGNAAKARTAWEAARAAGADMVALPEMFLTGHPPQGLVRDPGFVARAGRVLDDLIAACADGPALGIGVPRWPTGAPYAFNAWVVAERGRIVAEVRKHHLTREGGLDETRDFGAGDVSGPYAIGPVRLGTAIGTDARFDDVAETLAETGAEILLVPDGAPYGRGARDDRWGHMVARVVETGLPLVWLNLVGGQDDLVFDGASFALNPGGRLARHLPSFAEAVVHLDFDRTADGWRARDGDRAPQPEGPEADYRAMVAGLRDHMAKTGATTAWLGLSGDVGSALVAAVAADAIGPANLRCVAPAPDDAAPAAREEGRAVAELLGCRLDTLTLGDSHAAAVVALAPLQPGGLSDVAGAALRSRLRGLMLATLSEASGAMLLVSAGQPAIPGGTANVYAPTIDLDVSERRALCRWRNANHVEGFLGPAGEVVPARLLDPSTEQRPDGAEAAARSADPDRDILEYGRSLAGTGATGPGRIPGPRLARRPPGLDRHDPILHRWHETTGEV